MYDSIDDSLTKATLFHNGSQYAPLELWSQPPCSQSLAYCRTANWVEVRQFRQPHFIIIHRKKTHRVSQTEKKYQNVVKL